MPIHIYIDIYIHIEMHIHIYLDRDTGDDSLYDSLIMVLMIDLLKINVLMPAAV